MAKQSPNSGSIVALYAKTYIPESLKETMVGQLIGDRGAVVLEKELSGVGNSFTSTLHMIPTGQGVDISTPIDGNETTSESYTDTIQMGQISQAFNVPTNMHQDQYKVGWDYKKLAYENLKLWTSATFEIWFMNNLAGNTATTFGSASDKIPYANRVITNPLLGTGMNAATAPTTNRVVRAGGAASDAALTSSDVITLGLADVLLEKAKNATPRIEPLSYKGRPVYLWIVSPEQFTDLVRDNASSIQLMDVVLADLAGGDRNTYNEGLTGRGFEYRGVMIVESCYIPYGVSASSTQISTVRRSLFLGRGAATMGFKGAGYGNAQFEEIKKDGGRLIQISAHIIGGLKKRVFNSEDYGVIVCPTYAAAHTS